MIEFVQSFSISQERRFDSASLVDYIQAQRKHGELVRWRVLLACGKNSINQSLWTEDLERGGTRPGPAHQPYAEEE